MPEIGSATLKAIEKNFHAVVMERAGDLVKEHVLALPALSFPLQPKDPNEPKAWFPVPGMYGGFAYWFEGRGDDVKLIVESWCRVVEGSGQRHEITAKGSKVVAEGFV